jgi:UDP-2,3-diacylglucosamine hydrolase
VKTEPIANPQPAATGPTRRFFVADLHLDGQETPRALKFRELLERLAEEAKNAPVELYVLGDLFDFWYEYRAQLFELYRDDLRALTTAWEAGVKIFLLFGNRDFAYGKYVRRRFGATVLGDGEKITLTDARPTWLEHGDLLCTADRRYLRYRTMIRSWPVRMLFRLMPWALARKMIERIRLRAAADKASKRAETMQVDIAAARRRLEEHGCRLLICGHLHKAQNEDLGAGYRLVVLPSWSDSLAGMVDDTRGLREFRGQ